MSDESGSRVETVIDRADLENSELRSVTVVVSSIGVGSGTIEPVTVDRVVVSVETVGKNCVEDGTSVETMISVTATVGKSLLSEYIVTMVVTSGGV